MELLTYDLIFVIYILGNFGLVFREIVGNRWDLFDNFSSNAFGIELYLHSEQIDELFAPPQRLILLVVDYDIIEVIVDYDYIVIFSENRY